MRSHLLSWERSVHIWELCVHIYYTTWERRVSIGFGEKYAGCARTVFYMGIVPFSIDVDILNRYYIWGVVAVYVNNSVPPIAKNKPLSIHPIYNKIHKSLDIVYQEIFPKQLDYFPRIRIISRAIYNISQAPELAAKRRTLSNT